MPASETPSAIAIRDRAGEILAQPQYQLDTPHVDDSWIVSLFLEIFDWIAIPFRWIYHWTEGLPDFLRWVIVFVVALIAVALIAHIAYTMVMAIQGPRRSRASLPEERRRNIDPAELERKASEAVAMGDYITAIRLLFRASVRRLELSEKKTVRPGTTNRELLYRYRNRMELQSALRLFVDMIDRKWYGDEFCSSADFEVCQSAHEQVRHLIGGQHAVGT